MNNSISSCVCRVREEGTSNLSLTGLKRTLKRFFIPDHAQERELWIKEQLESLPRKSLLLDAGCGTQPYRKYCEALEYRAQDFGEYDGQGDGAGLQSSNFKYGEINYRSDIWSIPEESAHFDAILCSEVIEHIPYPNEAIREFARLLKPGGTLILTAPFCSVPHMTPYYFYSGFSKDYYRYVLKNSGFELESIKASGDPFMYLIQELRRLFSLKLPIVLKFALWPGFLLSFSILRLFSLFASKSAELEYLVFGYFIRARRI